MKVLVGLFSSTQKLCPFAWFNGLHLLEPLQINHTGFIHRLRPTTSVYYSVSRRKNVCTVSYVPGTDQIDETDGSGVERSRLLLVLLVFRDQVVHVGLGLGELHLIHALTGVPMQEGLTPEHGLGGGVNRPSCGGVGDPEWLSWVKLNG